MNLSLKSIHGRTKTILGWIGVGSSVILASIWALWGSIENFHEGWYFASIWENLCLFVLQYLLFTIVFVLLAVVILKWKRIGLILHLVLCALCIWFFSSSAFRVVGLFIVLPIAGLGLLYYFGDPRPRKWAYRLLIGIPLTIILMISIPLGIKASHRLSDNDFGTRLVEGNGVTLTWASRGPGWPEHGTTWAEACEICKYLSADGKEIKKEEQNIWRLPTVEEAVRSMTLHGKNAGGIWNSETERAIYDKRPDKETPLWDIHSKVIYYWTSDTYAKDERYAYIIVYHGGVFTKRKTDGQDYLGFRAVKEIHK